MTRARRKLLVFKTLWVVTSLVVLGVSCAERSGPVAPAGSTPSPLSPRIGEVETDRLKKEAESRIEATEQIVRGIDEKKLAMDQQATLLTIQNFLVKAREALVARDFIRASNLADKAKVLAEGLPKT